LLQKETDGGALLVTRTGKEVQMKRDWKALHKQIEIQNDTIDNLQRMLMKKLQFVSVESFTNMDTKIKRDALRYRYMREHFTELFRTTEKWLDNILDEGIKREEAKEKNK